ncbi:MAG TPA: hypothetical protein VH834_22890 [Solirubrobacteraceae bacterium]
MLRIPLVMAVAGSTLVASCGANQAARGGPDLTGQVRADTLAGVAKRIYRQEVRGEVGHAAVKRIARDRALLAALGTGNRTALRAAALRQLFDPGKHVVRLSVVREGRTLTNVGGAFVVAPAQLELRTRNGRDLGVLEASMQDVTGYVKLVRRLTGAQIVVRGDAGHVESSFADPPAALPASGTTVVAGRPYVVRSFAETGYAQERLTVWILTPVSGSSGG